MPLDRLSARRSKLTLAALNVFARVARRMRASTDAGQSSNERVASILVLELWNIGDVILVMPFLAQLRSLFPRAKITLVSRPFAVDLLAGTGLVDEHIAAELTWTHGGMLSRVPHTAVTLWRLFKKLRRRKFDLAFSSRLHVREHFLLSISNATRRVGFV